jgi:dienelactone hydrolase
MTIQTRRVEYSHNNAVLEGLLAWDDALAGPRPAVAIAHTWAGRGAFEEGKAVELAKQGYVGFAIDVYGKGILGKSPEENAALMSPLMQDRVLLLQRITSAVSALRDQPEVDAVNVAAMGYCFGGLCVLDLARSGSDVKGVVSLHGLFTPPENTNSNSITAKVLCLHGYDDPMAEPEAMVALAAELSAAGADWQVHAYGNTVHAFTNPAADNPDMGTVYSESADRRSRQALVNFLQEIFG